MKIHNTVPRYRSDYHIIVNDDTYLKRSLRMLYRAARKGGTSDMMARWLIWDAIAVGGTQKVVTNAYEYTMKRELCDFIKKEG